MHSTHPSPHAMVPGTQLGFALLYFMIGYTAHLILPNHIISLIWPSSGLALAVLLVYGQRYLWSVLLGSLTLGIATQQAAWTITGIVLGNTLEAWLGYWLLTEKMRFNKHITTLSDYLKLVVIGGIAGGVGAALGLCGLLLSGAIPSADALRTFIHLGMGHVLDIALLTSFLLSWQKPGRVRLLHPEGILLFGITLLIGQVVFMGWLHDSLGLIARGYWQFLCIVVIAIRMNLRSVTTMLLLIALQALLGALNGVGFFSDDLARTGLQNYWFYILSLSVVGISLSSYIGNMQRTLAHLKEMEQKERNSRDLLDQMAAISHTGGWQLTIPGQQLSWTREVYTIHELDPHSQPVLEQAINFYAPEARPIISAAITQAIEHGTPWNLELPFITAKGKRIWVRTLGKAHRVGGQTVMLNGVFQDFTDSKHAQDELLQANADLEGFSYSISHDLRTPLRAIDGFSNILLEDYRDKLDEEGRRLLNVVRANTVRMSTLIDDILHFSRAGRVGIHSEPVDTNALVRRILEESDPLRQGHPFQLTITELPQVYGDPALLHQVWENLISNAVKFSSQQPSPHLHIGAATGQGQTIFHVQDNGVGFDMKYIDKLFGVFQRLHSINEFPGTGIGLAIAKRIVTRHGGRIWAKAELDKGATFYFSIPNKESHHA